jgi:hypothetical protein
VSSKKSLYPTFRAHSEARCHICGKALKDQRPSDWPDGPGAWYGHCPDCKFLTFYDIGRLENGPPA